MLLVCIEVEILVNNFLLAKEFELKKSTKGCSNPFTKKKKKGKDK